MADKTLDATNKTGIDEGMIFQRSLDNKHPTNRDL